MPSYFHIAKIPCRCQKCGTKVRIPEDTDQDFLCPKCYDPVFIDKHATGEAPMMVRIQVSKPVIDEFLERDSKSLIDDPQQDSIDLF